MLFPFACLLGIIFSKGTISGDSVQIRVENFPLERLHKQDLQSQYDELTDHKIHRVLSRGRSVLGIVSYDLKTWGHVICSLFCDLKEKLHTTFSL